MLLALIAVLQAGAVQDTLPRVTLNQALEQATRLDPNYVSALGSVSTAEWGRRAATLAFIIPSVTLQLDYTKYSTGFFNIGTLQQSSTSATFQAFASYELFSMQKFAELGRSRAVLEGAEASELQARFSAALLTESNYYDVLANQELTRLAVERQRRAQEAFDVARARVLSGAEVQTDSLQLMLELTGAQVDLLRQRSALHVAQLQLGRRIGVPTGVDAVPLDSTVAESLPIELDAAVQLALDQGPQFRVARANERAARALLKGRRGEYLPTLTLSASHQRFDTEVFPNAFAVSALQVGVTLPLWDNAQREIRITEARVSRDVFQAIREDLERSARVDVTAAYEAWQTARATVQLGQTAVLVARENYRVQEARYRAGATQILDLLSAQLGLTVAESNLVQARFSLRLALAGLEAILGRRLVEDRVLP
jgi:outer membrane protein TolC